ncbi:MAG: hypothetical protein M1500_03515 [Candidatus Marsarchaeota archaeon]|nr:hypothetical protein [Candidatus Marsarchaeota archaeon]
MEMDCMGKTPLGVDMSAIRGKSVGRKTIARKATAALRDSDFSDVLESAMAAEIDSEATAALKSVLAQRATEYTLRASRIARRRGIKLSAATIIIAAEDR